MVVVVVLTLSITITVLCALLLYLYSLFSIWNAYSAKLTYLHILYKVQSCLNNLILCLLEEFGRNVPAFGLVNNQIAAFLHNVPARWSIFIGKMFNLVKLLSTPSIVISIDNMDQWEDRIYSFFDRLQHHLCHICFNSAKGWFKTIMSNLLFPFVK